MNVSNFRYIYNASLLFPFATFIFPKFIFYQFPYISHIPHFPSSWSFFRFFFSNVLSSGFPALFLPIGFQLSSLPGGHHIFPIRRQLFYLYFFCQMSHFQFSSLDCFPTFLFQFFTDSYRIFLIWCYLFQSCHVHQLSNLQFSPCFFHLCFSFFSFHSFYCLRISVPSLNTRHSLQKVVFPELSFNSKVFFLFHLSPRLFAISFQAACFSCFFSPWLQTRHGDALL